MCICCDERTTDGRELLSALIEQPAARCSGARDQEIRAALDQHWAASDTNDFETEHRIYQEDAVLWIDVLAGVWTMGRRGVGRRLSEVALPRSAAAGAGLQYFRQFKHSRPPNSESNALITR